MQKRTCGIEGCEREHYARTWCQGHYLRWIADGTPGVDPIRREQKAKPCSLDDCDAQVIAKGLCRRHYKRQARRMTPGPCDVDGCENAKAATSGLCKSHVRLVGLYGTTSETVAMIVRIANGSAENANGCWVWQLSVSARGTGYPLLGGGGYAHRAAWEAYRGEIPEGLELDHLCRNSRCVNPYHLEPVTRDENLRRRSLTVEAHMALAYS